MPTTPSSSALPLGTTFASELSRLEATTDGRIALANAQLSNDMLELMRAGDMSGQLAVSILQSRIVEKCGVAGIDVERVLVAMAKAVAHPKPAHAEWIDVLPMLATREDVAAAMIPYVDAVGATKLWEIFFPGVPGQLRYFINGKRKPAFAALVELVRFLMRDELMGHPIVQWTEDHAVYHLAKASAFGRWDPFDPSSDPFPKVQDYTSFKRWFDERVPTTHVEFVSAFTGLTKDLLDRWRRGVSQPSGEMLVKLFTKVREHHPEWYGLETKDSSMTTTSASALLVPTVHEQPHKVVPASEPAPLPNVETSTLAEAAQEVARLLEILTPALTGLAPALTRLAKCATRNKSAPAQTPPPTQMPSAPAQPVPSVLATDEDSIVSGRTPIGDQHGRIRFLLTSETFLPFNGKFTKGELADTRTLLRELARRLAVVNATTGNEPSKSTVVNELAPDLIALAAQLRGLEFHEVANLIGDADLLANET